MDRDEVLKTIAEFRRDEIVIVTMSPTKEWSRLSSGPLDFRVGGAMGFASSIGLGVALAQPDRRVIVLDGDGSLLMNLGTLVTICSLSPSNLIHFVMENELYETPGRIPLPGSGSFNLSSIARAAGLTKVYEFDNLRDFREHLGTLLHEPGPIFVSLKVAPGPRENL